MAIDEDIPEDVLSEILSRLPVKFLLRFKSVSKYWYSLIQNPSFISLHHNRSPKNESFLVKRLVKSASGFALSLVSSETPILDLDIPFGGQPASCLHLCGSSNGVVCLSNSSTKIIMLCNPAMREFRLLPRSPLHTWHTSHLGFAFDPKTNDYKVLRVAARSECELMTFSFTFVDGRVEIYDMSTDTWREIVTVVPKEILQCTDNWREIVTAVPKEILQYSQHSCSTWLNGVFYWVAADRNGRGEIIAFRMSDELFERVVLPEDVRINPWSSLSILGDSLALVTVQFGSTGSCLEIWIRDGNGVKDPWNKRYGIGPILGHYDPLGFRQIGELLLWRGNVCKMVFYNLDSHTINEYGEVYDDLILVDQLHVLFYTVNLVSVRRRV